MNWRYAPEVGGAPIGWSTQMFATSSQARAAGFTWYDGPIYTAYVAPMDYASQLPEARTLLNEMKERAAERGEDVDCFDAMTEADVAMLDELLRKTVANWEAWLVGGADGERKRSAVALVSNVERHEPPKGGL